MDWVVEDDQRKTKQTTKIHNSFICKQPRGGLPLSIKKYEKQTKETYKNKTSNYRCQCLFKFIIRIANHSLW